MLTPLEWLLLALLAITLILIVYLRVRLWISQQVIATLKQASASQRSPGASAGAELAAFLVALLVAGQVLLLLWMGGGG